MINYYSEYCSKISGLTEITDKISHMITNDKEKLGKSSLANTEIHPDPAPLHHNRNDITSIRNKIKHELKTKDFDMRKIMNKIEKYELERNKLAIKKEILHQLHESIQITPEEEEILFEKDGVELTPDNFSHDFEENFLDALKKLDKIKEFGKQLEVEQEENNLSNSLKERARYIEKNAYNKLVNFLKLKMDDFESPLEGGSKFITFVKITLELLKQKSDYYNHVVKELIESRQRYIEKSFNDKKYQVIGSLPSDKLSELLSWLHQSLINEIDILKSTHLEEERVKACTNSIFNSSFAKGFKKELQSFNLNMIDLKELFEIFYILENHVTFILEKQLPKIFDSSEQENDKIKQEIMNFQFIKPLVAFRETILKEFIEKSEDRVLEFKQCLIEERVFDIPKIFKELKYIFNGLIGVALNESNTSEGVAKYIRQIIRNFVVKIILSAEKENADGFIMSISAKTICLVREFYLAQRKVLENKPMLAEETQLITERILFLEHCLRLSTEREIWFKLGMEYEDQEFESIEEYVKVLNTAFEKLRWVPLKLNSLLHFNDYQTKQLIAEEAKNLVIMKLNELLQELVEY